MSATVYESRPKRAGESARAEEGIRKAGFRCYCGLLFTERESLDEHLENAHPERIVRCEDCGRVLPKGQWRLDEDGTFYPEGQGDEASKA